MTKIKKAKLKTIAFLVAEEDEENFRKEVQPILEKYQKYRYQRAIQDKQL